MRRVEGSVLILQCNKCRSIFPAVQFSGDTDMVTLDLVAATALSGNRVALGEVQVDKAQSYGSALRQFANHISRKLQGSFKPVSLRKSEPSMAPVGVSFREFASSYRPPRLTFDCIHCSGGAEIIDNLSFAKFEAAGGEIVVTGDLVLAT